MNRCTTKFQIVTENWKETVDDIVGSPGCRLKVINLELEGTMTPRVDKNSLRCAGKFLRNLKEDMVVGYWDKSSTIL